MTDFEEDENRKAINIVLLGEKVLNRKIMNRFVDKCDKCPLHGNVKDKPNIIEATIIVHKENLNLFIENAFLEPNSLEFKMEIENPDAIFFVYDSANNNSFESIKQIFNNNINNFSLKSRIAIVANNLDRTEEKKEIEKCNNELAQGTDVFSYEIDLNDDKTMEFLFMDMIYKILSIEESYIVEEELRKNKSRISDLDAPATAFVGEKGKEKKSFLSECCDSCLIV